ncbi:hypothetical protein QBC36DRAFT_363182 [Triangularia setosa]|uniref:Uncharacterized protein n=1 Tax=Triangularia setosa TaxID=2587417 RepID=A0AAN6WCA0_9PEZI|nr:hypothetical protein QBC36DRAFT_363182 [Podospora setosa]
MDNSRVDELLKSLECLQQSIKSLHQHRDARSHRDGPSNPAHRPRPSSVDWPASSLQRVATISNAPPQSAVTVSPRRLTNESPRSRPSLVNDGLTERESPDFLTLTGPPHTPSRNHSESSPSCVAETLPTMEKTKEELVTHLQSIKATEDGSTSGTIIALADAWQKRDELTPANILTSFETGDGTRYEHTSYQIYEVDRDGVPTQKRPLCPEKGQACPNHGDDNGDNQDTSVWPVLKNINADGNAVGRISILQEPTPLMLAATHLTMQSHFDMDELLSHLVTTAGNKGKTKAHLNRSIEPTPLRQRSFFFVFKYYTVVTPGLQPAPWQPFDPRPLDFRSPDHIDITSCSSILALSLSGPVQSQVKVRVKRKTKPGNLYSTFAPWQLLNIQYFPDDHHSPFSIVRSDDTPKKFSNGPHAFLDALRLEYRDAIKRYTDLNESITKLITPPNQFMFDVRLRDKLLFEDSHFTYSRRYFWAYNTLGVINEGIKSMSAAYLNNFTRDFWEGRHPTLWPAPPGEYLSKLDILRQDLEQAITELKVVYDKNEGTRTEIRSLREQLFSGSSVKESRRAIEQGKNIKLLTSVSMIFLPLTFVVGVFSITTLEIEPEDWRFGVTLVGVCVPFFLLILVLQSMDSVRLVWGWVRGKTSKVFGLKKVKSRREGGGGGGGFSGDRRHLYHHYQQHQNNGAGIGGHQQNGAGGGEGGKRWFGKLAWKGWNPKWTIPSPRWWRAEGQESRESTMEKGEVGREKRVE